MHALVDSGSKVILKIKPLCCNVVYFESTCQFVATKHGNKTF